MRRKSDLNQKAHTLSPRIHNLDKPSRLTLEQIERMFQILKEVSGGGLTEADGHKAMERVFDEGPFNRVE